VALRLDPSIGASAVKFGMLTWRGGLGFGHIDLYFCIRVSYIQQSTPTRIFFFTAIYVPTTPDYDADDFKVGINILR
jgi:hypothetical protein